MTNFALICKQSENKSVSWLLGFNSSFSIILPDLGSWVLEQGLFQKNLGISSPTEIAMSLLYWIIYGILNLTMSPVNLR